MISAVRPAVKGRVKTHRLQRSVPPGAPFTMPRFFVCSAVQKAAATQRKRLLQQVFCRHSIQHEGTPAPSYSPCETERFFSKQRFFDKLRNGMAHWAMPFLNEYPIAGFPGPFPKGDQAALAARYRKVAI